MLALLTLGMLINYLDRSVMSVAAPFLSKDLGLDAMTMGVVFSAFSWTYAAAQIPGGILLDRIDDTITEVERDRRLAMRDHALPAFFIQHAAELAQAPAQLAARIVRRVPQQIA